MRLETEDVVKSGGFSPEPFRTRVASTSPADVPVSATAKGCRKEKNRVTFEYVECN